MIMERSSEIGNFSEVYFFPLFYNQCVTFFVYVLFYDFSVNF